MALDEKAIRTTWSALTEKLGELQEVGEPVTVHDVPLTLERGAAHLQVAYRGDTIAGLVLREGAPTGRFGD